MEKPTSNRRRLLVSISAFLAFCCEPGLGQDGAASQTFSIFGVAIYLDRKPPCITTATDSVTVTVSPFTEQVDLGRVLSELARKAKEKQANVIYAINLVSFIPNQGAIATASTSVCPLPDPPPVDLSPLITR